jgi:uncharacterized protein YlxW (UPF0749 family)
VSQINDTRMLEMMRGTPPPTWEQTCLKLSEEKRELQSDVNELKELIEYLQDRIKLLKSTGDELLEWLKDGTISDSNYRLLANAWQRAKENKR